MLVQENLTGLGVIEQWGKLVSRVGGGKERRKKGRKEEKGEVEVISCVYCI